jgi:hypothetical protein
MHDEDWNRPQLALPGRLVNGRNAAGLAVPVQQSVLTLSAYSVEKLETQRKPNFSQI